MDEIEFRKRVYADPRNIDQETLNAAAENPAYQKILDRTQAMDLDLHALVEEIAVPPGLAESLLTIPATADLSEKTEPTGTTGDRQFKYYAIAASMLMAIGITFGISFFNSPSATDLAIGDQVLEHLYADIFEVDNVNNGSNSTALTLPAVNEVMQMAGTQLVSNAFMQAMPVRSARPCIILPAYQSAHLVLQGSEGAVSIIVINNSPVSIEYAVQDDRFNGMVIPTDRGNMIVIGESNEDLAPYKTLFEENIDWII